VEVKKKCYQCGGATTGPNKNLRPYKPQKLFPKGSHDGKKKKGGIVKGKSTKETYEKPRRGRRRMITIWAPSAIAEGKEGDLILPEDGGGSLKDWTGRDNKRKIIAT